MVTIVLVTGSDPKCPRRPYYTLLVSTLNTTAEEKFQVFLLSLCGTKCLAKPLTSMQTKLEISMFSSRYFNISFTAFIAVLQQIIDYMY